MPDPYIGLIGKEATTSKTENLAIKLEQLTISIAVDSYAM